MNTTPHLHKHTVYLPCYDNVLTVYTKPTHFTVITVESIACSQCICFAKKIIIGILSHHKLSAILKR
jgi:hypothetical protein